MADEQRSPTTGSLVWHLAMRWRAEVDRAVEQFGLTHAQYSALASLFAMTSGGGLPTQRELADYTGLQPIYISKLVRALEDRGFVRRTADRADARAVRLELTHAGRSAARAAMAVVRALDSALTEPIGGPSSTQTRTLGELLSTLLSAPRPAPAP